MVLIVVIDVDKGDCCTGVDMLDLGEEGGKASNKRRHPLILGVACRGDRKLNNWP